MQIYSLLIDIIVIAIFAVIVVSAYRKGFLRGVISVIGYIAAIFLAIVISEYMAKFIFDAFIRDNIIESINTQFASGIDQTNISLVVTGILASIPKFFANSITTHFGGEQGIIDSIENAFGGNIDNVSTVITDEVLSPIITALVQTIVCVILFFIFITIVRLISGMFQGFYAIPIIGPINSLLGGVLGIIQAIIILLIISSVCHMAISLSANGLEYFNTDIIEKTFIFKLIYNLKFI